MYFSTKIASFSSTKNSTVSDLLPTKDCNQAEQVYGQIPERKLPNSRDFQNCRSSGTVDFGLHDCIGLLFRVLERALLSGLFQRYACQVFALFGHCKCEFFGWKFLNVGNLRKIGDLKI